MPCSDPNCTKAHCRVCREHWPFCEHAKQVMSGLGFDSFSPVETKSSTTSAPVSGSWAAQVPEMPWYIEDAYGKILYRFKNRAEAFRQYVEIGRPADMWVSHRLLGRLAGRVGKINHAKG